MPAEPVTHRDPEVKALTTNLAAPFEPRDVKYKPQMVKNNRCLAMAYIDARLIQDRLDDVLGVENWQDSYKILPDGSVMCRLRCKLGDRWITKTDVGGPSEQPDGGDRLKAAFSDALKRAAVKFGVGRYLYRLPAQWVDYDPVKKQIVQVPQMPAIGIPKAKVPSPNAPNPSVHTLKEAAEAPKPAATSTPPTHAPKPVAAPAPPTQPNAEAPKPAPKPEPKAEAAKPEPKVDTPKPEAPRAGLPSNGQELHRRLQEYDAKLAAQKVCSRGALLAHVTQAGVKAGYTANLIEWAGPAIPFAVDAVKEFEQAARQSKSEPRTAA